MQDLSIALTLTSFLNCSHIPTKFASASSNFSKSSFTPLMKVSSLISLSLNFQSFQLKLDFACFTPSVNITRLWSLKDTCMLDVVVPTEWHKARLNTCSIESHMALALKVRKPEKIPSCKSAPHVLQI
ncbi:unnamed protein product [Ixodes pacificus]